MNLLLASVLVLVLLCGCLPPGVEPKSYKATPNRGSGISIGGSSSNSNSNGSEGGRGSSSSSSRTAATNTRNQLNVGLLVPHTNFGRRDYLRSINTAVMGLQKGRGPKLTFLKDHEFQTSNIHFDMMSLTPSPTGKAPVPSRRLKVAV